MFPIIDIQKTGMKIRQIMDERTIAVKQVQEFLNLSCVQTVYHWLDGTSIPTIDNLYALSELFQVPIDAMICGNRKGIMVIQVKENHLRLIFYYTKLRELKVASVYKGLSTQKVETKHYLLVGMWFGGFQALMPWKNADKDRLKYFRMREGY